MRDGTAEPVSRDQVLRRERGYGKHFLVQLTTNRIGNHTRLNPNLLKKVLTILLQESAWFRLDIT